MQVLGVGNARDGAKWRMGRTITCIHVQMIVSG
jgi:hypothetical protein